MLSLSDVKLSSLLLIDASAFPKIVIDIILALLGFISFTTDHKENRL